MRKIGVASAKRVRRHVRSWSRQIEIEKLKHENYLLTMERDLLKKLDEIDRRDAFHK